MAERSQQLTDLPIQGGIPRPQNSSKFAQKPMSREQASATPKNLGTRNTGGNSRKSGPVRRS